MCLLLALCVLVTYFNVDAILLTFLANVLKGCVGYGYWLAAPALLYAGIVLVGHKGRPVKLRTTCTLLLPVLVGMVLHLLLSRGGYAFSLENIKPMWKDGQSLLCGGVVSGLLAVAMEALLSRVVSLILTILLTLLAVLGALQIKPAELAAEMKRRAEERARWEDEDDYYDDEEEAPARPAKPVKESAVTPTARKRRANIDIPLDDEPAGEPSREAAALQPSGKSLFPSRSGDVKTPAELLDPTLAPAEAPAAPQPEPAPTPAPVKEPLSEKKRKEAVRAEVESATAEVSEAIEKELAEGEGAYRYPPITLLDENTDDNHQEVGAELRLNSQRLASALSSFGVDAHPGEVVHGPSVTRYEFTLDQGVKLSKLTNLSDDIALALGATGVRIAPIPGKISAVGIEVPNKAVTAVRIRDVIESREFTNHPSTVAFAVGKDIGGSAIVGNIARLPHVLIAGTTGSGKSVCTNSLIVSLLYKSTPDEVRFIMVDPKMVELAPYNGIPHLLIPVVTDPKKAAGALQWAVYEMMKRYKMFSERGVKDLAGFNALCESDPELKKLPTVVVVIDELADLMLVAAKEVEESICRVAQMGRAAGMHLVIATQRPSSDVITGLMKANIPSRIAFAVASSLESRIILDTTGAEKLVGKGDMLYFPLGNQQAHPCTGLLHHAGGDRARGRTSSRRAAPGRLLRRGHGEDRGGHASRAKRAAASPPAAALPPMATRAATSCWARRWRSFWKRDRPVCVHAAAALEAGLFPRRPSGGSDGGEGHRGPLRGQQAPAAVDYQGAVAGAEDEGQLRRRIAGAGKPSRPLRQHQRCVQQQRCIRLKNAPLWGAFFNHSLSKNASSRYARAGVLVVSKKK